MKKTDWTDYPKFENYNSFEDIQNMFDKLGLDFIEPVKTKWIYNISREEFKDKIDNLSLETNESNSKEENWIIKEVLEECKLIGLEEGGLPIIRQ